MTDSLEDTFAQTAAEVKRACVARNDGFFVQGNRPLVLLHRLNMRLHQQSLLNWAVLNLDGWGTAKVLGLSYVLDAKDLTNFLEGITRIDAANPSRSEQLLKENWPVLWDRLSRCRDGFDSILRSVLTGHGGTDPMIDPTRLDIENGPYDPRYHDHLMNWASRKPGESRTSLVLVTPLQMAWATQNGPLCEMLVKKGARLDTAYPQSSWPDWTLGKALMTPREILRSNNCHGIFYDAGEALRNVCAVYESRPELMEEMHLVTRIAHLEFALPAPQVAPKPRF